MPLPRLTGAGRAAPCPQRDGEPCAPLNRIWLLDASGALERAYAGCSCSTRFAIGQAKPRWRHHWGIARRRRPAELLSGDALRDALAGVPDADREVRHAAPGVVPVGTDVIHRATAWVDPADPQVEALGRHMVAVMDAAPGIGLAANQVGAGVRVIALNFPRLAPQVWANPILLDATGEWRYDEACLSLVVEGATAEVTRPREITVVADLPGGGHVVVEADELMARVVQHELDHLEGIEYVQRLGGSARDATYGVLAADDVPVERLPEIAYG